MMTNNNNSRIAAEMALAEEFKQYVWKRYGKDFSMYPDSETVFWWIARMRRHTSRVNDSEFIEKRVDEIYNNMVYDPATWDTTGRIDIVRKRAREEIEKE